jgi:hypothetical protein
MRICLQVSHSSRGQRFSYPLLTMTMLRQSARDVQHSHPVSVRIYSSSQRASKNDQNMDDCAHEYIHQLVVGK